ncbi:hypothetical protein [Dyadobacter soli]|nr:hypothetical protein [Dyadobacter soli]
MYHLIQRIVQQDQLHARWLNTLSFLENAGARKISACEDNTLVEIIQLKHAAEEHRHAYILKKQISKLAPAACPDYSNAHLFAPVSTRQYLAMLDIRCSRYLKKVFGLNGAQLRYAAYLFVTYLIEVRADELYPVYQRALSEASHSVTVKSIIAEEEGHLEEMTAQLSRFSDDWEAHAEVLQEMEQVLFHQWLGSLESELAHA